MTKPVIERNGDEWGLVWAEHAVGVALSRFREHSDGLHAEIVVESSAPERSGRLHGPVKLNLLSTESQTRLSNVLDKVQPDAPWRTLVAQACAIVSSEFRQGEPIIDLATMPEPGAVDYLYDPLVPEGETTIMWADGESGKSLVALALGLSARGGWHLPGFGQPTRKHTNVLYLDWETTARTARSRLGRLARGLSLETLPQVHYRSMHGALAEHVAEVRADVSRLGIGLVIVDSLSYAAQGELTNDEAARTTMNAMRQLSPATRFAIAHVTNTAAMSLGGSTRPFGSAFWWNGMRSGIELRKAADSAPGTVMLGLYHRKGNDAAHATPTAVNVTFDGPAGPVRLERGNLWDEPDLAGRTPAHMRIRAILKDIARTPHAEPPTTADLAKAIHETPQATLAALGRMGDVVQIRIGRSGAGNASTWGLAA